MAEIQIDTAKAERIIAQVLRDEQKMLPEPANALATMICHRFLATMPAPTCQGLQGFRIVGQRPPANGSFADALNEKIETRHMDQLQHEIWMLVYDRCRDLPPIVADAVRKSSLWTRSS
jgi:hypothetical protein